MKRLLFVSLHLVLLSLVVPACGNTLSEASPQPEIQVPEGDPEERYPAPTPFMTIATGEPPDIVRNEPIVVEAMARAMTDLSERLGIPENQVRVIDVQEVTWPDASLGCPQPGMAYAQVITPGYRIVLEALGERYPYHTDMGTNVVLCQGDGLPSFPITPGEIDDGQPWMPVN